MAASHSSCFSLNVLFVGLIGLLFAATHPPPLQAASFSMKLMRREHEPSLSLTDFVVTVKLGAPAREVHLGISLTGLLWVKCSPCQDCYESEDGEYNQRNPTTRPVPCGEPCRELHGECDDIKKCRFKEKLPFGYATGHLYYQIITVAHSMGERSLINMILGCTHRTEGEFKRETIGIFGLGYTPHSFVVKMVDHRIERMFSYCLPFETTTSSTLDFGAAAREPGYSDYSRPTPMDISDNMYRVTVTNIRIIGSSSGSMMTLIDGKPQPIDIPYNNKFVLDFAYKFTHVDKWLLDKIIDAVNRTTPFDTITVPDTEHQLCFNVGRSWSADKMPKIILIFDKGAEYVLETVVNAFEFVNEHSLCLTMLSNEETGGKSILGRNAQYRKRLLFDLEDPVKFAFRKKMEC